MTNRLSIIIITYNRPADMLELAKNIVGLNDAELLHEIIIVNNRSTESYAEFEQYIKSTSHLRWHYLIAEENLGVSRGRNFAISKSSGDILIFLDDDALFQNKDALAQMQLIFTDENRDANARKTGLASFKVYYASTGEMQQTAFPHKDFSGRKDLSHFEAPYFVGCAHAIRQEVFDAIGAYPEDFFYGMEEYDLSYKAIGAGYRIVYDNRVIIDHKESPGGRLSKPEKLQGMWLNKTKVAWRYLPSRYFYSTAIMWSFEYLRNTGFDLGGMFSNWKKISKVPSTTAKTRLSSSAIKYLKSIRARLWY